MEYIYGKNKDMKIPLILTKLHVESIEHEINKKSQYWFSLISKNDLKMIWK